MYTEINLNLNVFVDSLDYISRDDLYRKLWLEYVVRDITTRMRDCYPEAICSDDCGEPIEKAARAFVYDGEYDCNLSYWENIDNVIDRYVYAIPKQENTDGNQNRR